MKNDIFGRLFFTEDDAFNYLYETENPEYKNLFLENIDSVRKFNKLKTKNGDDLPNLPVADMIDVDLEEFDRRLQSNWFMPDEYSTMDIERFLLNECPEQNNDRLVAELQLFKQHNMINLLRYLKYLVDTMRSNNIVWGVGRGSSVASYALFLLGVHKIDSIKYKLDINEFLKEKENGLQNNAG